MGLRLNGDVYINALSYLLPHPKSIFGVIAKFPDAPKSPSAKNMPRERIYL